MPETIFYEWTEEQQEFDEWNYIGGGSFDPIFKTKTVKKQLRYSTEVNEKRMKQAKDYLIEFQKDHPDAKIVVRVDR